MEQFLVTGGVPLNGSVRAAGSKNCALPVLFATLLSPGLHKIRRVPRLQDMESTLKMLLHLGCRVRQDHSLEQGSEWQIDSTSLCHREAPYDLVRKMRASILCLGPVVAREGYARVSLPGGCAIGVRPIDLHLMALEKMGASIHESQGYVDVRAPKGGLLGALIEFPKISVGATENALMAACLANGTTVLKNAAQEPEILGLAEALKSMGAKIEGVGTSTIKIEGTSTLLPMNFSIPPDRIEVATYLIAAAMTGGTVSVDGVNLPDLEVILKSLELAGTTVSRETQSVTVKSSGRLCPVNIQTAPFPGFPTDVQAQWVALMTQADGETLIHETIFENRFMHVAELVRLGADIRVEGSLLKIRGTPGRLEGAPVMATDLRASASLVLAGLVAKGQTRVKRIYHLDRGYESMEVKLRSLGAQVERSLDS